MWCAAMLDTCFSQVKLQTCGSLYYSGLVRHTKVLELLVTDVGPDCLLAGYLVMRLCYDDTELLYA